MSNQWCLDLAEKSTDYIQKESYILEVGSRNVNGTIKPILEKYAIEYIGVDIEEGDCVDEILDVANLTKRFDSDSFDIVVSTEMLEHCENWQLAIYQMLKVLKPNGILILSTCSPGFELHDYPGDYWRFTKMDMRYIFSEISSLLTLEDDLTLGWACGVGIIARKTANSSSIEKWYKHIKNYTVANVAEHNVAPKSESKEKKVLIFDQFSRYKAVVDLLAKTLTPSDTILDIGCGQECLLEEFLPDNHITYLDPLLALNQEQYPNKIAADIFHVNFNKEEFDYVISVDTLEHIPSENREKFINKISQIAKKGLLLAFPCSDKGDAIATDKWIKNTYQLTYGKEYSWLDEHEQYGLPIFEEVQQQLKNYGWNINTIQNGHTPWLKEMLGFTVCAWELPEFKALILELSDFFNRHLYKFDDISPCYRQIIFATKEQLSLLEDNKLKNSSLSQDREKYYEFVKKSLMISTVQIVNNKLDFLEKEHAKLMEMSDWASSLNTEFKETKQENILLKEKLEQEQTNLETEHAKLMKISDWATELNTKLIAMSDQSLVFNSKLIEMSDRNSGLNTKLLEISEHNSQLKTGLKEMSEHNSALNTKLKETSDQNSLLNTNLKETTHQNSVFKTKLKETYHNNSQLNTKVKKIKQENIQLKEKIEKQQKYESILEVKIDEAKKALDDKHAQLMKMSDWASGMRDRLVYIDNSLLMKFLLKLIAIENRLKQILLRVTPKKLINYFIKKKYKHQNNIKYEEIKQSVSENNGKLIITFPVITWEFRWQRPQQIVSRLAAYQFTVIYLAMSLLEKGRAYEDIIDASQDITFTKLQDDIYQIWLHSEGSLNIYTDIPNGNNLNNMYLGLAAMLEEIQPKEIYYLLHFPGWSHLVYKLQANFGGKIIFDCMDDHGGFSTNTKEAIKDEEILLEKSDLVITTSDILEEKANIFNPNTIQIKNGTEFEHFYSPVKNGELDYLKGNPIIGYYGAISDWFDIEIIKYCAKQKPDWQFVLIGNTFGCNITSCEQLNNVHFLGEKDYKQLPGYLAYFDVCTIPFKIIPLTLATNPVKFYEYLSSGKPIVTVDLPELRHYQNDCYIALNKEEFLEKLQKAFKEKDNPTLIAKRIAIAKENSWDSRVKAIFSSI